MKKHNEIEHFNNKVLLNVIVTIVIILLVTSLLYSGYLDYLYYMKKITEKQYHTLLSSNLIKVWGNNTQFSLIILLLIAHSKYDSYLHDLYIYDEINRTKYQDLKTSNLQFKEFIMKVLRKTKQ